MREFFHRYRLPIVSGFLIGTSYIPFPPWALFFAIAPLMVFWQNAKSPREVFIGGWITQFILNLIGFHWIAYTAIEFGFFPVWAGLLTLLGFAVVAHWFIPIAGLCGFYLRRWLKLSPQFAFAVTAILIAICNVLIPMIFPWHFGYPWLWAGLPGAQFADVIGFQGLNLITVLINAVFAAGAAACLKSEARWQLKAAISALSAVAIFAAVNWLGHGRDVKWRNPDAEINALVVQGNIGNFDKLMVEKGSQFRKPVVDKYLALTRESLVKNPGTDFILWPETAFPDALDQAYASYPLQRAVRDFVRETQIPLMTGSYSYDSATKISYNGLFYIDANGEMPNPPYRKTILLAFGETFPFADIIPYDKFLPDMGSFGHGSGPTINNLSLKTGLLRVGHQICYEGLYPWFSVELARLGAEIIANVTNDSWFGRDFEPYQHMYMTFARAIEIRRPILRATNTGITSAILASGELLEPAPRAIEWGGSFRLRYQRNPEHTPFEKIAPYWTWILIGFLLAVIAADRLLSQTRKRNA